MNKEDIVELRNLLYDIYDGCFDDAVGLQITRAITLVHRLEREYDESEARQEKQSQEG